ncbi:MAG: hypothetical protein E7231_06575 [Cellulosilyticum sp.]|nr:hypothetical protein [Cellulosilyticum sp.]
MKQAQKKTNIRIEDMARVFNRLNISLKKLLELYLSTDDTIGNLHFDKKEIEKYLSEEDAEDFNELQKVCEERESFMLIGQVEEYEKEARLRQIMRNFNRAIKKELILEDQQGINTDLRTVILHVEMRPMMYLRRRSIYELDAFLRNIVYGAYALGKTYSDTLDENSHWGYFSEWLGKKYESAMSMGWCQILMEKEHDEEKAFWRFFDEFRDYLEEVEHYKSKREIMDYLIENLMEPSAFIEESLEAELENYPNKYAREYYERSCYQLKVYRIKKDERYGKHRRYLQTFYVDRDLARIWVRYRDTFLYQTLEEFLKDNEDWYRLHIIEE